MTFSLEECLAYDGPHCDCFTFRGEPCHWCGEEPPDDDDDEGEDS